jgi:hypothetical protein
MTHRTPRSHPKYQNNVSRRMRVERPSEKRSIFSTWKSPMVVHEMKSLSHSDDSDWCATELTHAFSESVRRRSWGAPFHLSKSSTESRSDL